MTWFKYRLCDSKQLVSIYIYICAKIQGNKVLYISFVRLAGNYLHFIIIVIPNLNLYGDDRKTNQT